MNSVFLIADRRSTIRLCLLIDYSRSSIFVSFFYSNDSSVIRDKRERERRSHFKVEHNETNAYRLLFFFLLHRVLLNISAMTRLSLSPIAIILSKIKSIVFISSTCVVNIFLVSMGINLNDLESLNQSFNANPKNHQYLPEIKKPLKNLSVTSIICLIILPIVFIIIGIIYRNSCLAKSDLPLFLIIFGILILINLLIYTIVGATFLERKFFSNELRM